MVCTMVASYIERQLIERVTLCARMYACAYTCTQWGIYAFIKGDSASEIFLPMSTFALTTPIRDQKINSVF